MSCSSDYSKYYLNLSEFFSNEAGAYFFPAFTNGTDLESQVLPVNENFVDESLKRLLTVQEYKKVKTFYDKNCENLNKLASAYLRYRVEAIEAVAKSLLGNEEL